MKRLLILLFLASVCMIGFSQQKPSVTSADYKRAVGFLWQNVTNKKAFNLNVRPNWLSDSTGFWYLHQAKAGKTFMKVLFAKMKTEPMFDHARLATTLTDLLHEQYTAGNLPFNSVEIAHKDHILFTVKERNYDLDLNTYQVAHRKSEEKKLKPNDVAGLY